MANRTDSPCTEKVPADDVSLKAHEQKKLELGVCALGLGTKRPFSAYTGQPGVELE